MHAPPSSRPRPLITATALALASLILSLPGGGLAAHADRFGPPFVDRVTADGTTVYATPDRTQPIGPLPKDAILVVLDQQADMIQVSNGWVPTSDVTEITDPWVAQVTDDATSIVAYPDAKSDIRRTAYQGDLLRVWGVSRGVNGDGSLWWATNEGYVILDALGAPDSEWASRWTLPDANEALHGWWGQAAPANVRAGPTSDAPILGEFAGGEHVKVLAEEDGQEVKGSATWYRIDGGRFAGGFVHSSLIDHIADPQPTVAPPPSDVQLGDEPWIVINRQAHTLTLLRDGQPQFVTYVSLGKAGRDTPDGGYSTWGKHMADRMSSAANRDADHAYDLPNVPFVQYYKDGGYGIHGTYWHDQFGTNQSQGCINLTVTDSAYLFGQTLPKVGADGSPPSATAAATPVIILG